MRLKTSTAPDYIATIKSRFASDFENNFSHISIANTLLDYVTTTDPKEITDLSFGNIKSIVKQRNPHYSQCNDSDFATVISTLTGGRYRLLDNIFTFIDQYSGIPYPLSKQDILQILQTGKYYHPIVTDELVEDIEEHIIVSYKASKLATVLYQQGLANA